MSDALEILSDEDLNTLVAQKLAGHGLPGLEGDGLDHLSDDELNKQVAAKLSGSKLSTYDPMQGLSDAMRGVGQGVTAGHLPQVQGALSTGSISGPDYEAAKLKARAALDAARMRNAPLVAGGEVLGGVGLGEGAGALIGEGGALKTALTGAGLSAAQNPGGDVDAPGSGKKRLENAMIGLGMGGALGGLREGAAGMAENRAFKALAPMKRDVVYARDRGNMQSIGRDLLDNGVIGNLPASKDTMLDRVADVKNASGAKKSGIIDELDQLEQDYLAKFGHHPKDAQALVPVATDPNLPVPVSANPDVPAKGGIDLNAVRGSLRNRLALNPDLPEAASRKARVDDFVAGVGQSKDSMSVKAADKLKTDTGAQVNWMRQNTMGIEPERQLFHKELYNALNKGVDDAADVLAKQYKPELAPELAKAKKTYGNMAQAEGILDRGASRDFANRLLSPSDYGMGAASAVGAASQGKTPLQTSIYGAAAAGINQFLRRYGNQISAKQLDNLSKALNQSGVLSGTVGAASGSIGAADRRRKLKALEE